MIIPLDSFNALRLSTILIMLMRFKRVSITFTTNLVFKNYFMRLLLLLIILMLTVPGCNKDKQPLIPYVYVNLQLYPNSMDYIPVGGYKYINEGFRGIIIYRILPEEFAVYERCCPYDPESTGARVTVDPSGSTCIDAVCKSQFILYDGTPYGGPSPYSLMQYRYSYDGETLQIYN